MLCNKKKILTLNREFHIKTCYLNKFTYLNWYLLGLGVEFFHFLLALSVMFLHLFL